MSGCSTAITAPSAWENSSTRIVASVDTRLMIGSISGSIAPNSCVYIWPSIVNHGTIACTTEASGPASASTTRVMISIIGVRIGISMSTISPSTWPIGARSGVRADTMRISASPRRCTTGISAVMSGVSAAPSACTRLVRTGPNASISWPMTGAMTATSGSSACTAAPMTGAIAAAI